MAIETEKKYRLTKHQYERVESDLKEFEARYLGKDFEENIIYGGDVLFSLKAILRIRKIGEKTTFTFKKRIPSNSDIKEQIEHETQVENADEMGEIIEHLGFEKRLIYEKHRRTWHFREVEIVLDKLPFGLFMEVEGTFMAIKETEMILGADEFETEYKSYPFLTKEYGKKNGKFIEARF